MEAELAKAITANFHGLCCWLIESKLKKGAVAMHGYRMVGDLLCSPCFLVSLLPWPLQLVAHAVNSVQQGNIKRLVDDFAQHINVGP